MDYDPTLDPEEVEMRQTRDILEIELTKVLYWCIIRDIEIAMVLYWCIIRDIELTKVRYLYIIRDIEWTGTSLADV